MWFEPRIDRNVRVILALPAFKNFGVSSCRAESPIVASEYGVFCSGCEGLLARARSQFRLARCVRNCAAGLRAAAWRAPLALLNLGWWMTLREEDSQASAYDDPPQKE